MKFRFKIGILGYFLWFLCANTNAQRSYETIDVSIKSHYGFIWAHTPKNSYLTKGHFPLMELSVFGTTSGLKQWQNHYNKPQTGISIIYSELANKENFGYTIGIFPWINFKIIKHPKYKCFFKTGFGLGYINKTFNLEDNYKNIAISAHINALACLQIENQVSLAKNTSGIFGISLFHESNGASKLPNTGINFPTINLGLAYQLKHYDNKISSVENTDSTNRKIRIIITSTIGYNQMAPLDNHHYAVFELNGSIEKPYNRRQAVSAGIDLLYEDIYRVKSTFTTDNNYTPFNLGVNAGHTFYLGNLNLTFQEGMYIASKDLQGKLYSRLALRYYLTKRLTTNFGLWFHDICADHFEWGLGYRIR